MDEKKLLIAVPTKNHPKQIMYYLSKVLSDAEKLHIDILILDGSQDDLTENVVSSKLAQNYSNLFYRRYDSNSKLEERCRDIYVESGYEYVWLCGDGCVLNLTRDIKIVEKEMEKEKDFIVFGEYDIYGKRYVEFDSPIEFCKECFAQNTFFGSVIIKDSLVSKSIFEYCETRYLEHAVPAIYYEIIKGREISATYIHQVFYTNNPYKKKSIAMKEGRTIYAFAHLFNDTIRKLPDSYNEIKKDIQKWQGGMYEYGHLWALRVNGNYNMQIFLKEKKYLKKSSNQKMIIFFLIALCRQNIAKPIALIEDQIW